MKRVTLYTLIVLATLALLGLLWVFRFAVVLFLMSLFLAAAARPLTEAFNLRLINRTTALLIIYLLGISVVGLIAVAVSSPVLQDLELLTHRLSVGYEQIYASWPQGTPTQQAIVERLPRPEQLYALYNQEGVNVIAQGVLGVTSSLGSFLAASFLIVVLSIYWSVDRVRFERLWMSLLPVGSRSFARATWRDIEDHVGAYLRSELVRGFLAGIFIGLGLSAMRVPYASLLGVAAGILSLIPWLGAALIALPVFLAAASGGLGLGAGAVLYTIAVLVALEAFVQPRFFSRQNYSSLLMVILAFTLVDSLGLLAILAAPALTAAIQLFFQHMRRPPAGAMPKQAARQVADLQTRLKHIHAIADQLGAELTPQGANMIARLDALVAKANEWIE